MYTTQHVHIIFILYNIVRYFYVRNFYLKNVSRTDNVHIHMYIGNMKILYNIYEILRGVNTRALARDD